MSIYGHEIHPIRAGSQCHFFTLRTHSREMSRFLFHNPTSTLSKLAMSLFEDSSMDAVASTSCALFCFFALISSRESIESMPSRPTAEAGSREEETRAFSVVEVLLAVGWRADGGFCVRGCDGNGADTEEEEEEEAVVEDKEEEDDDDADDDGARSCDVASA